MRASEVRNRKIVANSSATKIRTVWAPPIDPYDVPRLMPPEKASPVSRGARGIQIVYHIGALGAWEAILREQLELLKTTGLADRSEHIYVQVSGMGTAAGRDKIEKLFRRYSYFYKVRFEYYPSLQVFEFPSIQKVQEIARNNPACNIMYFHTKGASYPLRISDPRILENYKQWRKVMEYFNIQRWQDCVAALNTADTCGIEYGTQYTDKPNIFGGNFWWAKASYINRCQLNTDSRFDCEFFIGSGNPKVKNFFASGSNPKLRQYFTESEIYEMTNKNIFVNLWMFDYYAYYLDEKYYKK